MDIFPILSFGVAIGIVLSLILAAWSEHRRKKKLIAQIESIGADLEDTLDDLEDKLDSKILEELQHQVSHLQEQADHTSKMVMLLLKHQNLEHQVQPQRDVLVTVGDLSDIKKSKGRSA